TVRVVADWVHVASSAMWLGGLFGLAAIVLRGAADWRGHVVGVVAARFSRLAGVCLGVVVVTGVYNTWTQIPFLPPLWMPTYGRARIAKIVVVVVVIAIGALNRFTILPGLAEPRPGGVGYRIFRLARFLGRRRRHATAGEARRRLALYVTTEAMLGVVV